MNSILILSIIVAVIARICTQEAIFVEVQRWAASQQKPTFPLWRRKLTYPLQCQFCFSVWVSIVVTLYVRWAWPVAEIIGTVLVIVGIANAFLIAYEIATAHVTRIRIGNHHRTLNLDWKRIEFEDWSEWRAKQRTREYFRTMSEAGRSQEIM